MINFIKRLCWRDSPPDVILYTEEEEKFYFAKSKKIGRRRVAEFGGYVLILNDDGTTKGSHRIKRWEAA